MPPLRLLASILVLASSCLQTGHAETLSISANSAPPLGNIQAFHSTETTDGETAWRFPSDREARDPGQSFRTGAESFTLDAITVRVGPTVTVGSAVENAAASVQFYRVDPGAVFVPLWTSTGASTPSAISPGDHLTFRFGDIAAGNRVLAANTEYAFVLLFDSAEDARSVGMARDSTASYSGGTELRRDFNTTRPAVAPGISASNDLVFYIQSDPAPLPAVHPFLLVNESDFPAMQARASEEPWASAKTRAIQDATTLTYDYGMDVRDKSARFVAMTSSNALAYILDPDNRATYLQNLIDLLPLIDDVRTSRVNNKWNSNVPTANAVFNATLALDLIHNDLTPTQRNDFANRIQQLADLLRDDVWKTSAYSARGTLALYRGDRATFDANKAGYRASIEGYLTDDGVFTGGPNYGFSRFAKPEREQKWLFMDVLEAVNEDNYYDDPKLQGLYEWLYSATKPPEPEETVMTFGDGRIGSSFYRKMDESARSWSVHHFSESAAASAAWHVRNGELPGRFAAFALADRKIDPVRPTEDVILADGGAWFRHDPGTVGDSMAGAIWNVTKSDDHTHKDTNSVFLTAFGEHLLVNSGYSGWGNGAGGSSWNWINSTAESSNTVKINDQDHAAKYGDGLSEALASASFKFARGESGPANSGGTHSRNFMMVPPTDGVGGYWILADEITDAASNATVNVALHAYATSVTTDVSLERYHWSMQRYTPEGVDLTAYLATPPTSVAIKTGGIANGSSESIAGKYLYNTYTASGGEAAIVTLLFPHDSARPLAAMNRIAGSGFSGATVDLGGGIVDTTAATTVTTAVTVASANFAGRTLWSRDIAGTPSAWFARASTEYLSGAHGFTASTSSNVLFSGKLGQVQNGAAISFTLHYPDLVRIWIDGAVAEPTASGDGFLTVALAAGEHQLFAETAADLAQVTLEASAPVASHASGVSGGVTIRRVGDVSQPLPVNLAFSGDAVEGLDFAAMAETVVIPAMADSVLVEVTPLPAVDGSPRGNRTLIVSADPGEGYLAESGASVVVKDTVRNLWLLAHFTEQQWENASITGDSVVLSGGLPNLLTQALELNPWSPDLSLLPEAKIDGNGKLYIEIDRPKYAGDVVYEFESSSNLSSWQGGEGFVIVVESPHPTDPNLLRVRATDVPPSGATSRFMRLNVGR